MPLIHVKSWFSKFTNGQIDLKDKQRPVATHTASTEQHSLAKITNIITN